VQRTTLDEVVEALHGQRARLATADPTRLVIAYEPAWAIGAGAESAPADWVGQVHAAVRATLASSVPEGVPIPIIYGGSVAPESARALLAQPCVDGLFVGRQALDPRVFAAIAHTPAE
jgi:triosephosphate isomerase